ncbi:hypothetical protein BC828DRAFT_298494 [Blastocladiella britannica]|nr:hypothetical protein BC828DRAFT_298494 [Blastocladiella britannica]
MFFNFVDAAVPQATTQEGTDETQLPRAAQLAPVADRPIRPARPYTPPSAGPVLLVAEIVPELTSPPLPAPVRRRHFADVKFAVASRDPLPNGDDEDQDDHAAIHDSVFGASDLEKGVFEGGLKTWECASDLAKWIASAVTTLLPAANNGSGLRILELGCGSALPSLALVSAHVPIQRLTLQDYNPQVLDLVTAPNVLLAASPVGDMDERLTYEANLDWADMPGWVNFVSGDWSHMVAGDATGDDLQLLPQYDLIMTSETIYELSSTPPLLAVIESRLAPGGVALVAAKSVYFGVGGSLSDFVDLVVDRGVLKARIVYTVVTGGVRREILELTCK